MARLYHKAQKGPLRLGVALYLIKIPLNKYRHYRKHHSEWKCMIFGTVGDQTERKSKVKKSKKQTKKHSDECMEASVKSLRFPKLFSSAFVKTILPFDSF